MSSRDWQLRIRDILKAINSIQKRTRGMSFEEFAADETAIEAVLITWETIQNNLPTLIALLENLLKNRSNNSRSI